jgi:hypothetical protein
VERDGPKTWVYLHMPRAHLCVEVALISRSLPGRSTSRQGGESNPKCHDAPSTSATKPGPIPIKHDQNTTLPSDPAFLPANRRQFKISLPGSHSSPGGDRRAGKRQRASNHREYVQMKNVLRPESAEWPTGQPCLASSIIPSIRANICPIEESFDGKVDTSHRIGSL